MREAKDKHSNICVPDLCHIKLGWLIHPLQNYSILHQKDAIWQKRRMHLQSNAFPTKWVGGWERLNINPVHCEGGSLAAELWREGDILRHITTRNPGIRAVQNISSREGLRTTDHGKRDAFWSCPDGRAVPWPQCGSGDGRPQATYVDPATRKIRRSLLAWVDSLFVSDYPKNGESKKEAKTAVELTAANTVNTENTVQNVIQSWGWATATAALWTN